jgi:hypothetical protein
MEIQEFKKIKNRQRPDLMFQFRLKKDGYKFEITTMNSGKTFSASVESLALNGETYLSDSFREGFESPEDCINEFETFLANRK